MARPKKTGLDYFPFDVDFFNDEKIEAISGEFGIKGEIVAIKLLAAIYRNGYFIEWSEMLQMKMLKTLPSISKELLTEIVQRLVRWNFFDEGLFNSDNVLTSRGIQRRYFEAMKRNSLSDSLPFLIVSAAETPINVTETTINTAKTPQSKEKESKVNISFLEKKKQKSASVKKNGIEEIDFEELSVETLKEEKEKNSAQKEKEKSSAKAFTPPSPSEVAAYCRERGNDISPESFCSFYASKGWRVGNQPMKDWRAAIRHWETRRSHENKQPSFPKNKQSQPLVIDENGNILSAETNNNTTQANTYVAGRQTAASLSANLQGW